MAVKIIIRTVLVIILVGGLMVADRGYAYPGAGWGKSSSAGHGDCLLRTIVDADNEVAESDESPLSNIWQRQALVAP